MLERVSGNEGQNSKCNELLCASCFQTLHVSLMGNAASFHGSAPQKNLHSSVCQRSQFHTSRRSEHAQWVLFEEEAVSRKNVSSLSVQHRTSRLLRTHRRKFSMNGTHNADHCQKRGKHPWGAQEAHYGRKVTSNPRQRGERMSEVNSEKKEKAIGDFSSSDGRSNSER